MSHGTRIVVAVFAAAGAVALWFSVVYGGVLLLGATVDVSSLSDNVRTALTTGVLGASLAGAVFAGLVCFFVVAGGEESRDPGSADDAR